MNRTSISLLALVAAGAVQAAVPSAWSTNLTAALAEAATNPQPVLVWFTASWCGPCRTMARTTLVDEPVLRAISGMHCVVLDIDQFAKAAEQHGVRAVPTFELLSPEGDEVVRITGLQEPAEFLGWVTNGIAEVKQAAVRRKMFREKLATIDRLLAAADPESARKAATAAFDCCAERESEIVQAAAARLKTLADLDPVLLLDGLLHPRLAARIQVANVLRVRVGDAFDVDPWSDPADRQKAVEQWRQKLAGSPVSGL